MRIIITGVLMGLVAGMAGCNSRDSKQVHNGDRPVASRGDADRAPGSGQLAPLVNDHFVNQAAGQAVGAINTATATADRAVATAAAGADRAANGVIRTAATVQIEAQQATTDAAKLSNQAARDGNNLLNNANRDLDSLKNVLR